MYISNCVIWRIGDSLCISAFFHWGDYWGGLSAQRLGFEGVILTLVLRSCSRWVPAPLMRYTEWPQGAPAVGAQKKNPFYTMNRQFEEDPLAYIYRESTYFTLHPKVF